MFEIDSQTMAASAPTAGNANQVSLGNAVANRMNAFENFGMIQSDAALRQVAGQYAYCLLYTSGDAFASQLDSDGGTEAGTTEFVAGTVGTGACRWRCVPLYP